MHSFDIQHSTCSQQNVNQRPDGSPSTVEMHVALPVRQLIDLFPLYKHFQTDDVFRQPLAKLLLQYSEGILDELLLDVPVRSLEVHAFKYLHYKLPEIIFGRVIKEPQDLDSGHHLATDECRDNAGYDLVVLLEFVVVSECRG